MTKSESCIFCMSLRNPNQKFEINSICAPYTETLKFGQGSIHSAIDPE